MTTKLTLSIDPQVAKKAKRFAKIKNKSLSSLVKELLEEAMGEENTEKKKSQIISVIGAFSIPNADDLLKKGREAALKRKLDV